MTATHYICSGWNIRLSRQACAVWVQSTGNCTECAVIAACSVCTRYMFFGTLGFLMSWVQVEDAQDRVRAGAGDCNDVYGTTWRTRQRTTMGNQVGNYTRGATRKARNARPDRMARHVQRVLVHYYIMFVLIRGIPFHSIPRSIFYSQPICMGACQHRPHLQLHLVWDLHWYTSFLGCVKLWHSHSLGFTLVAIGFIVRI